MATATMELEKKEAEAPQGAEYTTSRKVYSPLVDIMEREDDIVLVADMPGVDDKSVDITLEKNVLTIYGKVDPLIPERHKLGMSEYGIGDYQRSFTLSDEIDRDRIEAVVKNGVLRLVLPKAETAKTRKIAVKAEA